MLKQVSVADQLTDSSHRHKHFLISGLYKKALTGFPARAFQLVLLLRLNKQKQTGHSIAATAYAAFASYFPALCNLRE